jgi:hypothetical protein
MNAARKILPQNIVINEKEFLGIDWTNVQVCSGMHPVEVLNKVLSNNLTHIIDENTLDFNSEIGVAALLNTQPDVFFQSPTLSIADPSGKLRKNGTAKELISQTFTRASEKNSLLQTVEENLMQHKTSTSLRSDVMVVVDELVTNAIYNAPFVDKENKYVGASRIREDVELHPGHQARLMVAINESRIVIGVTDPYGKLHTKRLLERIKRCYDAGVASTMNLTAHGGAGIGSFMVYNSSSSYFIAVDEGSNTTVCAALPLKMSSRARQELPKNIHIFVRKKE